MAPMAVEARDYRRGAPHASPHRQRRPLLLVALACLACALLKSGGAPRPDADGPPGFVGPRLRSGQNQHVRAGHPAAAGLKATAVPKTIEVDLIAGSTSATGEAPGEAYIPSDYEPEAIVEEERSIARDVLLKSIEPLNRGFTATEAEKTEINRMVAALAFLSPNTAPAGEIGGNWTLLYTNDPNTISSSATPFSHLGRIGQEINSQARTITNVIEYHINPLMESLVGAPRDSELVQKIYTDYEVQSPSLLSLKVRGLDINPQRVLGYEVPEGTHFEAKGPLALPFGQVEILYLDYDLRITRTGRGWHAIYRRETGQ